MAYVDSKITQGTSSVSATMPTFSVGDMLIALGAADTAVTMTTSGSTWTKLDTHTQASPDAQGYSAWWRVATGSDTLTITGAAGQAVTAIVSSFSGRSSSAPGFKSTTPNTSSNASPATVTLTGVTAAAGDDIALFPALDTTTSSLWGFSTPSGYTPRQTTTSSWAQCALLTQDNVGAGATGNFSITATRSGGSGNAGWSGYVVNIAAASSGTSVALTGQSVTYSQGTLAPAESVPLTSLTITYSQGTLIEGDAQPLIGQTITYSQGTLVPAESVALTGLTISYSQGTVTYAAGDITVALSGQTISYAQGALSVATDMPLSGQSITYSQGTLAEGTAPALTGQTITYVQGSLGIDIQVPLTGQSISYSQGTITYVPAGDITVALTGQSITYVQGTLTASVADDDPCGNVRRRKTRNVIKNGKFIQEKIVNWPFEQPQQTQHPQQSVITVSSQQLPSALPSVQSTSDEDTVSVIAALMVELL